MHAARPVAHHAAASHGGRLSFAIRACRSLAEEEPMPESNRFRRTLLSVMTVQAVTLLLLWLLQSRYSG
jgi:hypothetical protein